MNKKNKQYLFKALLLLGVLFGANNVFAADGCKYLPLVPNIIAGDPTGNTTVCVDIPNPLFNGNKTVWDMDLPVTTDGLPNTTPAGLRHMWMMSVANNAFATKNGLDKSNFKIYGVIHGTALSWALNDAWWESQVDEDGNQLYPNGNPEGAWIQKVLAMKDKGLDVQLEVCGVTLMGAGLSSDDVYPGILVNQGAFGRFQVLHQQGFMVIQEGWIDNDKRHHDHD